MRLVVSFFVAALCASWAFAVHAETLASGYESDAVEAFVSDCAQGAGRAYCTCVVERYQAEVPWHAFVSLNARLAAKSPSEHDLSQAAEFAKACFEQVGLPDAGYTKSVVSGYMNECVATAGEGQRAMCACTIERFKAEIPWPEFYAMIQRLGANKPTEGDLKTYQEVVESCRGAS
jgi:hypothetical protein